MTLAHTAAEYRAKLNDDSGTGDVGEYRADCGHMFVTARPGKPMNS